MPKQNDEQPMMLKSRTSEPVQVALLSGHCIVIGPEGREVPPMFLSEAFMAGCIPMGVVLDDTTNKLKSEPSGADRETLIKDGMKAYLEAGETMTNQGLPNLTKLSSRVGFTVTKEENVKLFNELQLEAENAGGSGE